MFNQKQKMLARKLNRTETFRKNYLKAKNCKDMCTNFNRVRFQYD